MIKLMIKMIKLMIIMIKQMIIMIKLTIKLTGGYVETVFDFITSCYRILKLWTKNLIPKWRPVSARRSRQRNDRLML